MQILFADSENTQIYVLTSKNSVYKSSDGGESWKKQMSYMSHSDDKQPGYDEAGVQKMFKSPIDGHVCIAYHVSTLVDIGTTRITKC